MIKCITFDLDDTLWWVSPVIKQANRQLYEWLDRHAPAFTATHAPDCFVTLREPVVSREPEIAYSVSLVRQRILRLGLEQAGYQEPQLSLIADQAFDIFLAARQQVELFPEVKPMLQSLQQQGYLLGVITNGNAHYQRTELASYFEFQFSADLVGVEKPDPKIYQAMLDFTGLEPSQVVHIGDNPETDIRGAQALGIDAVWVDLHAEGWQGDDKPAATVACVSEISEALEQLVKLRAGQ